LEGRPKIAISRDFWHFFILNVFLKREPRGIQKPKWDLPMSPGSGDMAVQSFNFDWNYEEGRPKTAIFSTLCFWTPKPWTCQNLLGSHGECYVMDQICP
jgi:hypothetical protein